MSTNELSSIENLIQCQLCSKFYDDPRLLPCLHTYCFRCIKTSYSINKQNFACPSCHTIEIHPNEINSLPSNSIINDLIQLYHSMKTPLMCLHCEISPSDCICNQCMDNNQLMHYCSSCYSDVHSKGAYKKHQKFSQNHLLSKTLFCSQHPDERLKHWCDQCQTTLCSDCRFIEHSSHSHQSINHLYKESEKKIKIEFEHLHSKFQNEFDEITKSSKMIVEKSEFNKRKLSNSMNYLREIIDEHEKQMFNKIEQIQQEEFQQLEQYQFELNQQLNYFQFQYQIFRLFIQINEQISLLKNRSKFFEYISQTTNKFKELETPRGIEYQLNGYEQLQTIKELIQHCVTVQDQQIIPISIEQTINWERLIEKYQTENEIDFTRQIHDEFSLKYALQILAKANNLISLNLSDNRINSDGIEQIIEVLQNNQMLTMIDFSNNDIGDDGMKYLANFLQINQTLTTLYLNGNGIGEQGIEILSNILQTNPSLTILDLQSNRICSRGAQHLAKALRKNTTLTTLYLSNNQISNQGVQYFAECFQENSTLMGLIVSDNQIDNNGRQCLREMSPINKRLVIYW